MKQFRKVFRGSAIAGLAVLCTLAIGPTSAYSATPPSALKALNAEIAAAVLQTTARTPLNPDPALGLEKNYGPTNMSWKCYPVRAVSTEPLCKLGTLTATRTIVLYGDSQTNMWAPHLTCGARSTIG